jgi:hypothetical protein
MILATLLVLSSPTGTVSMQAVNVNSQKDFDCKTPIDYRFGRMASTSEQMKVSRSEQLLTVTFTSLGCLSEEADCKLMSVHLTT